MPSFPPTAEQQVAIDLFLTAQNLKTLAYAGAGKTSTLTAMAAAAPRRRGVYLAFNRSIADEAATKFPRSVQCSTAHSMAYRAVAGGGQFGRDKMGTNLRIQDLEPYLPKQGKAEVLALLRPTVMMTLRRFYQSWDPRLIAKHVPIPGGLDEEAEGQLRRYAQDVANAVWSAQINPKSRLPLGHDGYLKLWALGCPTIRADYILVDEAQDLNAVLIEVLSAQKAQLVSVGDSHQQIYEWRGARDALRILGGAETRLTQSFRFGDNIAQAANAVLAAMGEVHPLQGFGKIRDRVITDEPTPASVDAVLCRTNSGVIGHAIDTLAGGRKVYVPGGVGELITWVEDAIRLENGGRARSFELAPFESWAKVVEFAQSEEGRTLSAFVNMVKRYGTEELQDVLAAISPKPVRGALTISTAHKSKGLEWESVGLANDFAAGERIGRAERRLFYVAMTRAKKALYVDQGLLEAYSAPMEEVEGE